jgi:hypothetical protein
MCVRSIKWKIKLNEDAVQPLIIERLQARGQNKPVSVWANE